jgi:hypothetical protein
MTRGQLCRSQRASDSAAAGAAMSKLNSALRRLLARVQPGDCDSLWRPDRQVAGDASRQR